MPQRRERARHYGNERDLSPWDWGNATQIQIGRELVDKAVERYRAFRIRHRRHVDYGIRPFGKVLQWAQCPLFGVQCRNRGAHGTAALDLLAHFARRHAQVFSQQPVAEVRDDARDTRFSARLDRQIAFGVESH
ncbi:hypothetical protein D3C83_23840 [compost metagenome]